MTEDMSSVAPAIKPILIEPDYSAETATYERKSPEDTRYH